MTVEDTLAGLADSTVAVIELVHRLREKCARGIHDFPEDLITGQLGSCTVCGNPHYIAASGAPTAD